MPPLQVVTLATVGGLQGSEGDPQPSSYDEAENFIIHRGRMGLRAPLQNVVTVKDSGGGDVDAVVGMALHNGMLYYAGYDDTLNEVNLYESDLDGTGGVHKAVIWSSVTAQPTAVIMQTFTAGAADASQDRLYICDYDQNHGTCYWTTGTTITNVTRDFDQDTGATAENAVFSFIIDYQFHLWGTSYIEGTVAREEFIRFSTPGAIPLTDIVDSVAAPWHVNDFLQIGRRGDPITALTVVNQRLLVFQQDATHAINGYDRTSWTVRNLSDTLGAVGPRAVGHYDGKVCFFWTSHGPAMSDGEQVIDITEPIRDEVNELTPTTKVVVLVDPVMAQAYFFVPSENATYPNKYFAYDITTQKWTSGQYLDSAGDAAVIGCGATAVDLGSAASGPGAAPTGLASAVNVEDEDGAIDISWINGDNGVGVRTEIYRHTTTFTPGATYYIATVEGGAEAYTDTGLLGSQIYYYNVRHIKNSQYSSAATEISRKTWTKRPTGSLAKGITGIAVYYENLDDDTADIEIYRRDYPGGAWGLTPLTTRTSVAPATPTFYNDLSAATGELYEYQLVADIATFDGSVATNLGHEEGGVGSPLISDVDYNITYDPVKPWIATIHVTWVVVRADSIRDRVWLYKDVG